MNSLKCLLIHLILFHHLRYLFISICVQSIYSWVSLATILPLATIMGILLSFTLPRWPQHIKLFIPLLLQQCSPHPLCAWLHYYWLFPPCTFQIDALHHNPSSFGSCMDIVDVPALNIIIQKLSYRLLYYLYLLYSTHKFNIPIVQRNL